VPRGVPGTEADGADCCQPGLESPAWAIANRAIANLFPALRRYRAPPTGRRISVQRAIAPPLHIDQPTDSHISRGSKKGVRLRGHTPKIEFFPMRSSGSHPCIKRSPSSNGYLANQRTKIHLTTVTDTLIIPSGIRGQVCHSTFILSNPMTLRLDRIERLLLESKLG
jgi:hypothetical protein